MLYHPIPSGQPCCQLIAGRVGIRLLGCERPNKVNGFLTHLLNWGAYTVDTILCRYGYSQRISLIGCCCAYEIDLHHSSIR
jgi:hypothetical protein